MDSDSPPKPLPDWEAYACLVEKFWSSVGEFFHASEAVDVLVESRLADNRHHATALCVVMLQDGVFLRVGAPPAPFRDVDDFRYRLTWSSAKDTGSNVRLQRAPAIPAPIASFPRKRSTPPPEFDDAISEASGEWQVKPVANDDQIPVPSPPQLLPPSPPSPRSASHSQQHQLPVEHYDYSSMPTPPREREREREPEPTHKPNQHFLPLRAAFERINPRAKKERTRSTSRDSYRLPGSGYKTLQQTKPLVRTPSLGTRDTYRSDEPQRSKHLRSSSFDIPPPLDRSNSVDYTAPLAKASLDVRDYHHHPAHRGSFDDKFLAGSRRERMYRTSSFDVAQQSSQSPTPPPAPTPPNVYMRSPSIDATQRRSSRDQFVGLSRASWRPPSFDSAELTRSANSNAQHHADLRPSITRSSSVDGRHHTANPPPASSLARSSSVDGRYRVKSSWNRQAPLRAPNDSYSTPKRKENPFDISRLVPRRNIHETERIPRGNDNNRSHSFDSFHAPVSPDFQSPNFDAGVRSVEPNGNVMVPQVAPLNHGRTNTSYPNIYDDDDDVSMKEIMNHEPVEYGLSNAGSRGVRDASIVQKPDSNNTLNGADDDALDASRRNNSLHETNYARIEEQYSPNNFVANDIENVLENNLNGPLEVGGDNEQNSEKGDEFNSTMYIDENVPNSNFPEADLSPSDNTTPSTPEVNEINVPPEFGMETIDLNADINEFKGLPDISVDLDPEIKGISLEDRVENIDTNDIVSELKEIAISDDVSPSEVDTIGADDSKHISDVSPEVILLPYGPVMSGTEISTEVPTSNIDTIELMHGEHEPEESPKLTPNMSVPVGLRHDEKNMFSDVAPLRIDTDRFGSARNESTGISSEITSSPMDSSVVKKEASSEIFGSPYGAITSFEARDGGVRVIDIHRGEAIAGIPVEKEDTMIKNKNGNVTNSRGREKENGEKLGPRKKREDGLNKRKKSSMREFMRNASDASLFGEDNVSVPTARKQSPAAPTFMTRNASDASLFDEDSVGGNLVRAAVSEESGSRKMPYPSWDNEDFGSQFDVCRSFDVSKRSCEVDDDSREPVAMVAPAAVIKKRVNNPVRKSNVIKEELPQRTPYMRAPSIDVSVMENSDDFEIEGDEPRAISMDLPRVKQREEMSQPNVEQRAIQLARDRNRNRITQAKPEPLPNVGALREKLARAFQQPPNVPAALPRNSELLPKPPAVLPMPESKDRLKQQEQHHHQQPPPPVRDTESSPVTTPRRPWRFLRVLSRGREEERASSTFTDSEAEGDPASHKYRTTSSFRDRFVKSLRRSNRRAGRDTFADREDPTEQAWRSRG